MHLRSLLTLALAATLSLGTPSFATSMYATSADTATPAAMPTCPDGDPVVWVNTKRNVYHVKGDAYFGKTKQGKYACKSAAIAAGARGVKTDSSMGASMMTHHRMMSPGSPAPTASGY